MAVTDIIVSEDKGLMTTDGTVLPFVASFDVTTPEGQALAFNASQSAEEKLDEHVGEEIDIAGFYVEVIGVEDDITGEVEARPHVIIIDADGVCYEAQSKTLPKTLAKLDSIYHISEGGHVKVEVGKRKARVGQMFTLKVVL